jgi:hypothetical protein
MKVGIIAVYMDSHRRGHHHRGILQPQIGPLIAGLLPPGVDIDVVNDTWTDPDWTKDYDLLFISSLHSDFDRARQISHYWRRRGAKTVYGGTFASTYTGLCRPYFDSIVVGDAEGSVPAVFDDFCHRRLQPVYVSGPYNPEAVRTPRVDLLAQQIRFPVSLEGTRGCPFFCDFCALTGIGTRYHTRPPEAIIHDIRVMQEQLRGLVPSPMLRVVTFYDNNLGGNLAYLSRLCELMAPLNLRWGAAVTFNVVSNRELVEALNRAGCRLLFVGIETFNPVTLNDMRKFQNVIDKTRSVIDHCIENGIMIESGLLINPVTDDADYVGRIPDYLRESHLYLPNFLSFEAPFPGTPYFERLAVAEKPAMMPNAMLRDFNGYSLVIRPQRETVENLIDAYERLRERAFSPRARLRKLAGDLPVLLSNKRWCTSFMDTIHILEGRPSPHPDRTHIPETDIPPPEANQVPFTASDFDSEEQRRAILDPFPVTDAEGRVLPQWLTPLKVFEERGRVSLAARSLVAAAGAAR